MEKILILNDENEAAKKLALIGLCEKQLQSVVSAFNKLSGKENLKMEELRTFFADSRVASGDREQIGSVLAKKLIPTGKINGVPVNWDTITRVLNIPPIDEVMEKISATNYAAIGFIDEGFFEIKQGSLKIAEGVETQIRDSFKKYAENEMEKDRFEKASALANALNEVCKLLPEDKWLYPISDLGDLELILNDENGIFSHNPDFVKSGKAGKYRTPLRAMEAMEAMEAIKSIKKPVPQQEGVSTEFLKKMGLEEFEPEEKTDEEKKLDAERKAFRESLAEINKRAYN